MRFFNLDLHIAVIGDIKQIFSRLGHEVTTWSLSAHSWVMGQAAEKVDIVNRDTWKGISPAMCNAFYERYKHELDEYDAFIVTYPASFSMLYERWNKPIICVAATRYEAPLSGDPRGWERFNAFLREKIDAGIIIPVANNKYDAAYAEYFTGRKWKVITSLCDYTNAPYTGERDNSLYVSKFRLPHRVNGLVSKEEHFRPGLISRIGRRLGFGSQNRGYSWQELASFRSAVIVPYNASIMSIFEMYAAGMPMLFPSQQFAAKLYAEHREHGVFSELSFNQVANLPSRSLIPSESLDPNNYEDISVMTHWIAKSDFYDLDNLKHLVYFNSFEEIGGLLESIDVDKIHHKMSEHHCIRSSQVYSAWKEVLNTLSAQLASDSRHPAKALPVAVGCAERA